MGKNGFCSHFRIPFLFFSKFFLSNVVESIELTNVPDVDVDCHSQWLFSREILSSDRRRPKRNSTKSFMRKDWHLRGKMGKGAKLIALASPSLLSLIIPTVDILMIFQKANIFAFSEAANDTDTFPVHTNARFSGIYFVPLTFFPVESSDPEKGKTKRKG